MRERVQPEMNSVSSTLGAGKSRRHFLKIMGGGATLAGAALLGLPLIEARAKAGESDIIEKGVFPASGTYTSKIFKAANVFNAVGAYWEVSGGDGNKLDLEVRVSDDGTNFSDWKEAEPDSSDSKVANTTRFFSRLVLASGGYIQYRVNISGLTLSLVGLSFIDSKQGPKLALPAPPELPVLPGNAPYILKRSQWGANEAWRFENGKESWPRDYVTPKVMIVHHSETANVYNDDPSADVRGIYYYHAITKGWGDIGYNYLIDWKGNIYEGRYGGDNVVAGHALQYNWGSIGVCLVGSFKSTKPSDAMLNSLVKLLTWKASNLRIDPNARLFFVDRANVATISGHRDVISTGCPGDAFYPMLPQIRQRVTEALGGDTPAEGVYNMQLLSLEVTPTTVIGGQTIDIKATVKNTGTLPIETQGPNPGYTYEAGQDYMSADFPKINNRFRLTLDYVGNTGTVRPFRWGFGKTLQPGEQVTITGKIKMRDKMATEIFGGVIQEYVKYHVDNYGRQPISVLNADYPTRPAASRASDPNITYFPQTGHNLGYAFRQFWQANGGLAVFGFPLTEEFVEVSPTDNKAYTVQYFERNRFEYHPENKGTKYEVLMGLLGNQLTEGRNFPKTPPFADEPGVRIFFPQTGHRLDGVFLRYWQKFGGLPIFGFPISEPFEEKNPDDGKTYVVQYFERNRFEYHPEFRGSDAEVLLGLLGKDVLRRRGWLQPGL